MERNVYDKSDGEKRDEIETQSENINRRCVLKLAGAAGAGSILLTSTASAGEPRTEVELRKEKQPASSEAIEATLKTDEVRRVLADIGDTEFRNDAATRIDVYLDDSQIGHSFKLPIQEGVLSVTYADSSLLKAAILLDRKSGRNTRRLSRNIGWPDGTEAMLAYSKSLESTIFVRTVTDSERKRSLELIDRSEDPLTVEAIRPRSNGSGEYRVVYRDATYHLDQNLKHVERIERVEDGTGGASGGVSISGHGPGCVETGTHCLADILAAAPHFAAIGLGCSITGVASLGCLVIAADFLLPNVALIAVSGNCSWVVNNCQPYL